MDTYKNLINNLHEQGAIRNPAVLQAFQDVERAHFLPAEVRSRAGENVPLPIGYGQTNSQPYTVAFLLELLEVEPGMKVLDVGCGSGWTSALLGHMVGINGQVTGTEIVPELASDAAQNTEMYSNVEIQHTEEVLGAPEKAPFDRILVSAEAETVPQALLDQLASTGILVVPIGGSVWKLTKHETGEIEEEQYPGFVFVPLV